MSNFLTSADIEDGKTEYDPATKSTSTYKLIEGGYEIHIKTPQPNGTMKTAVKTFWDPKPVSEEEVLKEQENKKLVMKRMNKEIRIDKSTTMLTRAIEGGWEEVYTTTHDDGTKSSQIKTFYDSVPMELNEQTKTTTSKQKDQQNKNKKALTKVSSVDSTDSADLQSRRVVSQTQQQRNVSNRQTSFGEEQTVEESRRFTQNIEITENNRTVRKNSVQDQSVKSLTSKKSSQDTSDSTSKDKTKKTATKKSRSGIPPPPPEFIENDSTKVISRRTADGGIEYVYRTVLETGKTITTSKIIYEEESHELTEEEVKEYKKTLKDAAKLTNVEKPKKLKSELGTKKVVPSENPGDVTTVETIKIDGGTEYHYTTVTAEGIVKKSCKTIYDQVKTTFSDNETDEEEIVEEYEEEVIEPGEPIIRTVESIKKLPQQFSEEVTITSEKKEKKVKKSMKISS